MGDREGRAGLEVAIQEGEAVSMKERGSETGGDLKKAACFIAIYEVEGSRQFSMRREDRERGGGAGWDLRREHWDRISNEIKGSLRVNSGVWV
ncbi:hypothetical protein F2Q68_00040792 [Brassica cretica]|uniref:Uncharacterized protein n=1 Tax=Brassica cretica TaxID=69181 RepID=A0A8S9MLS7_BRACR|nr:hypothetical protein F2Q68_00040792 [Brassica cretica]